MQRGDAEGGGDRAERRILWGIVQRNGGLKPALQAGGVGCGDQINSTQLLLPPHPGPLPQGEREQGQAMGPL